MSFVPLKIHEAEYELKCQLCQLDYVVWFTDNDLWNTIQEWHRGPDRCTIHFLCPRCFMILAEAMGIRPTAWYVTQEKL